MDSILFQKQVKDNSEDLQTYFKELRSWEGEMKQKESQITGDSSNTTLPPVRSKSKKIAKEKTAPQAKKVKSISSYDYSAWDKFDVDAECEKIDKEDNSENENSEQLTEEEKKVLLDEAIFHKEKGNNYVKEKKYNEAIECYTLAIDCHDLDPVFYANRGLCYLKLKQYQNVETDCTTALQLDSSYVKALQRRAAARIALNQLREAESDLKKVLELEPQNNESKVELARLQTKINPGKKVSKTSEQTEKQTRPAKTDNLTEKNVSKTNEGHASSFETKKVLEIIEKDDLTLESSSKTEELITEISTKSVKSVNTKSDPQIGPSGWFKDDEAILIKTIKKPPHLRSKKPLKHVEIQEIDFTENKSGPVKNVSKFTLVDNKIDIEVSPKVSETVPNQEINKQEQNKNLELTEGPFSVPKNVVQFTSQWKSIDQLRRFNYLCRIPPEELPNIFQNFLEADIFSEIISVLATNFIMNKKSVFSYLTALTNVKRFSTLSMFMTSDDKKNIVKLLDYCENFEKCNSVCLNDLKNKYVL